MVQSSRPGKRFFYDINGWGFIGPAPARDSYLNANLIVHSAKMTGCDALHAVR